MITKVVNVNLQQPIYEKLTAKRGDIASRYLLFHLLDGDKPFDLTGKSVRVYARKPDKTEIFNDLIINDKTKGYCTLELTSQCLAKAGIVKMELYISESDKVLTSIPFKLEVIDCINTTDSIISTNEFTALTNGLVSLSEYDNYKNEISEARKGHGTVGERLNNFDSMLDTKVNKKETYLNVKDFGAKGDGVNDDAIAIQSALNYATNNLKIVYIPRGNYKIGNTLLIPDNTHLKGDNKQFTVLSPTDKFKNSMINKTLDGIISHNLICNSNFMSSVAIAYNSNTNIEISDIFFKWGDDKSLPEYANNCIGLNNCKQIKIHDCQFRNWGQHSIDVAGCSDVFIERNINLFGYWSSVQVDEGGGLYQAPLNPNYSKSARVYIRDNFFQENAFITGSIQIHKNGGTNIFIENNVIVGSLVGICTDEYWTANYTVGYNNNLFIRNNVIDSASISNTIGIQIAKNYDNVVIENNFSNCYFPIKIRGGKPNYWNEHIVIKNNSFNGKECEMIGLSNSIVSDNIFNITFNRPIVVAKNSVFSNNIFKGFGVRIKDVKETDPRDNSIYSYESENITFEKNIFTDLSNPSSFTFTDVGSPRKFKFLYNNYFNYTSRIDFGSFSDKSKIIIEDDYSQRKETVSSSTRPATPIIGMCVFDETLKKPIWYNGTNWIDATGITV